jgi:hypothetical protein
MYIFAKARVDYADEFDCYFFGLFPKEKWDRMRQEALADGGSREVCFGTNEYLEVADPKDWLAHITVTEVSQEEAVVLARMFNAEGDSHHETLTGKLEFVWGTGSRYLTCYNEKPDEE